MKKIEINGEGRDKLIIKFKKKNVEFDIYCDYTGFNAIISKDKLKDMLK